MGEALLDEREIWGDMGEIWGDMGEIWGDMGRYGQPTWRVRQPQGGRAASCRVLGAPREYEGDEYSGVHSSRALAG